MADCIIELACTAETIMTILDGCENHQCMEDISSLLIDMNIRRRKRQCILTLILFFTASDK